MYVLRLGKERPKVQEELLEIVQTINSYLSNYVLIVLLIGAGLFFTIRTRGVQFRCFGEGMRRVFGNFSLNGKKHESGMSSFQALATAVAAQVGTGNIVGACGAILVGGPGAIFWMWLIAILGMATNYAEAVLAQKTRRVDTDGTVHGGPVYYIKTAFHGKFGTFLAGFFSVAIILALGFMGCMVQSNSIASTCATAFSIPTWIIGLLVAAVAGFIFLGGVKRLASVTEKIVPFMAIIYILGGLAVLVSHASQLPAAFGLIFECAFNPQAQIGGVTFGIIAAISQGAKRGLFSNEAGMGSTPHAHALANVKTPHEQGVVAMIGVFIDTIVVVSITALVVITILYTGDGVLAQGLDEGVDKTNMAQIAFSSLMGGRHRQHLRGHLPAVLRLLHHPFVEPVRQDQRDLPVRQEGRARVLRHRPRVHLPGVAALQRPRVGAGRHVQPAHGAAQRHRARRPFEHCGPVRQDQGRDVRPSRLCPG